MDVWNLASNDCVAGTPVAPDASDPGDYDPVALNWQRTTCCECSSSSSSQDSASSGVNDNECCPGVDLPSTLTVQFTNVDNCVTGSTSVTRISETMWSDGTIDCFGSIQVFCEQGGTNWRLEFYGISIQVGIDLTTNSCDPLDLSASWTPAYSILPESDFPCCGSGSFDISVTA